ncbi:MAG TPA: Crp/Fnr family transcriptional regulator [Rubrobacteraceae bacterium]|nr:Crp/Fnr family transcriptional regulator [Rubrobacteraceae bacterium]
MDVFLKRIVEMAGDIFRKPLIATGLYALAVGGVLATMDRRVLTREPAYPRSGEPAAPTVPPEESILQEFERSGLRVVERRFGRGELIFTPGDPDAQLYFLRSGAVRVYKTYGDYKEATVALLKDGGVFGKLDLAESSSQDDFAEASTEARVATVRKPAVAWLVKRRPDLALSLFSAMSERMKQSDDLIVTLLHREVSSRLAALLSNLGDRFGERNGQETLIDVRLTHMELANMIASTREAVSKAMTELQREGLIEVRNRQVFILNHQALAERADNRTA